MSRQQDRRRDQLAKRRKGPTGPEPQASYGQALKKQLETVGLGQTLFGLLPAGLSGGAVALIAYLLEYSTLVLVLSFLASFVMVEFILWRATTKSRRIPALISLGVVLCLAAGYAIYLRYENDRSYVLTAGELSVLRQGFTRADGEAQVTDVNLQVMVQNTTNRSLFYRVERRYGNVEGHASSLFSPQDQEVAPFELEPNHEFGCYTDPIPGWLANGQYHSGEIDCEVAYGKSKDKLDKRFTYKTKIRFFLCPRTGLVCGTVDSYGRGGASNDWIAQSS